MDLLSDIIRLLRPESVLLGSLAASGRWGVVVPEQPGPTFYFILAGRCWYRAAEGAPVALERGDLLLSARPAGDTFLSEPGAATVLSDEAFKARHSVDGEIRIGDPEEGPATRITGGLILCDPANAALLAGLIPRFLHVRATAPGAARLHMLIEMVREEHGSARPGRDAILARLIEVLLIEALRRAAAGALPEAGLLRGLADPQLARALADIHADVGRGWTVAVLAKRAGMSRSVFARRFSETIGAAPVEYLLNWRMALARDALRQGRGTMEEVAAEVGYRSASAFSTAFKREMGFAPSEYGAG